ncbi:hypothetical protein G6F16_006659 [Rhizopus arrhizus]|nr:hypothetical protein G6F22_009005 [Rhizopus arrhizus]KAG0791246.1 hypothetical protein G6F21_005224 [Rhizopus arrhizus]KAG0812564.1 hypothetical protein G6F20_006257 [Rhizopus arrhizus]KAG0832208.1 hypothetical protein G6F19_006355 [Rhizopus arrhizus]KAG0833140.1 hypothetical protein G6F18_006903 [Rhizopus arrhizus]
MEYYPETETEAMELAYEYGEITTPTDFDVPVHDIQMEGNMEENLEEITTELSVVTISEDKKKKNKYGPEQIRRFIEILQEEGVSVPVAAKRCMIPRSTAYKLFNEFNAGDGTVLPGGSLKKKANRGTAKKIFPEHTRFLVSYFDEHPSSHLEMARGAPIGHFEERDSERILRLRQELVSKWKEIGVDFQKNCVFIDESGFNSQMMRGRAWSRVGEPAKVKVHSRKGVNISIIGCISPFGTINFSKVEPLQQSDVDKLKKEFPQSKSKKRKAETETKKKPLKKGTTSYHIVKLVQAVMDVLDKHVEAINNRGYKPLFMSPYSPFLNPIEERWSKIKSNIKRAPLDENSILTPHIVQACQRVTIDDCLDWIRHSESYWDRCINKELSLN